MKLLWCLLFLCISFAFCISTYAQIDDICREYGAVPTLDAPKLQAPFVYGKVALKGTPPAGNAPKVTVTYSDAGQPSVRQTFNGSGSYCFKRTGGDGILVIDVAGTESIRKTIPAFGQPQQREDFEVSADKTGQPVAATVVSARFPYDRNPKTSELFAKVLAAERDNNRDAAITIVKEIVEADPLDFIAFAKLGSLYFEQAKFPEAELAFKRSLALKVEYTPAWIYMGRIRVSQKQPDIAIEIFKQAIITDPRSARAYQLLGETYLQTKQGTLGAEALHKAIDLDPDGMAASHLLLAKLYDLAGAKAEASREYKAFLVKRPKYTDRAKIEKYVKENP